MLYTLFLAACTHRAFWVADIDGKVVGATGLHLGAKVGDQAWGSWGQGIA